MTLRDVREIIEEAFAMADVSHDANGEPIDINAIALAVFFARGERASDSADGATPRPMAWLGFPEGETPKHDLVYDGTTQLPGYRYLPIWRPEDHPSALREQAADQPDAMQK